MNGKQGIHQYQQIAVKTVTPERMIVMLYEGVFRFLERARRAMADKNIEARTVNLNKAQAIIQELNHALDHDVGARFTRDLEALYRYADHELTETVITNDPRHVDNVVRVLEPLHRAWAAIPMGVCRTGENALPVLDSVETDNISLTGTKPAPLRSGGLGGAGPESSEIRKTSLCVAV